MLMEQSYNKKRGRDSDLLQPLPTGIDDAIPASLELKEVLDPEVSHPKKTIRVVLMTGPDPHHSHRQSRTRQDSLGVHRSRNNRF